MEKPKHNITQEVPDSALGSPRPKLVDDDYGKDAECDLNNSVNIVSDDDAISSTKEPVEVLIEIEEDYKKIVKITDVKDLESSFFKAVAEDTALEEFIDKDVTFQIFDKFTWVDLDRSVELIDGTHLKAVFHKKCKQSSAHGKSYSHKDKNGRKRRPSSDKYKYRSDKHHKYRKRSPSESSGDESYKHHESRERSPRRSSGDESYKHRESRKRSPRRSSSGESDKHRESRKRSPRRSSSGESDKHHESRERSPRRSSGDESYKHRESRKRSPRRSSSGESDKHHESRERSHRRSSSGESDKHHESRERSHRRSSSGERYKHHTSRRSHLSDVESGKYHKSRTRQSVSSDDDRGTVSTTTPKCDPQPSCTKPHYDDYLYSRYKEWFETINVKTEDEWVEDDVEKYFYYEPVSKEEIRRTAREIAGKNPTTTLHELCNRLKWKAPRFEMHKQSLSVTDPQFIMKVTVRGKAYIPETISRQKKTAKSVAAEYCLKELGVLTGEEEEEGAPA